MKSVKDLLRKVMGQHLFTAEELFTSLTQIETTLNSRPLAPLDSPPADDDIHTLTPRHFLVGRPMTALPQRDLTNFKNHFYKTMEPCQKLSQEYWQ